MPNSQKSKGKLEIKLYDSQTRKIRTFKPLEEGLVKMYVCGPTVYDHVHVGHARSQVFFDVMRRVLEYFGYRVFYVSNYTDIDDKMINRAKERGISVAELAKEIIASIEEDFAAIGVRPPTIRPKATEHMDRMVEIVAKLIDKGYAYVRESGVYFRVQKFQEYGKMTNFSLEQSQSADDDGNPLDKEHRADFALMKKSKDGEPYWETPWGKMRPGWHIECSAMSIEYLGETFDIHGGGQDLSFPHHVNEIAQSEAYTGKKFSNFFCHNGFLTTNNEKMSKSLNNFFTIKDVVRKYGGDTLRLFLLQSHYRKPLEYSIKGLEEAKTQIEKIRTALNQLESKVQSGGSFERNTRLEQLAREAVSFEMDFAEALANDINTVDAIAVLHSFIKEINTALREVTGSHGTFWVDIYLRFKRMLSVLGLFEKSEVSESKDAIELVNLLIKIRQIARSKKDWELSDTIRDQLKAIGYQLEDLKTGTVWKKAKD